MIISERIFNILNEKRLSQKRFSELTGISQSTISDWKTKKTNPAADKIMVICDVLEVTPYELLSGAESRTCKQLDYIIIDKESEEYQFIEVIKKMDVSSKDRLRGYIQALQEK